jgi:hypothetical protein
MVSTTASILQGSWAWAALAAGTVTFMAILFAGLNLASRMTPPARTEASVAHHLAAIRDGQDDCPCLPCGEFEADVEALAIVADVVPGLVPADGKPLSRAERRALRGIEAATRSEREEAGL